MSQIDAIRSFTILKEEKTVDPIVEAASDFLNMTNPHMISEVFETHVLNLDRWKTKAGFKMLSSGLIGSIILKTFCEFEGFDLAKDDIKEKALRDTKRDHIFH